MPDTPIYSLPFEVVGDQPGITLHGGLSGTEDILAEAVETELERIDDDVADLQTDVARGWHDIISGDTVTTGQNLAIPAGVYDMVRISVVGSLDAVGTLTMRVNEDTTANLHESAWMTWDPEGEAILEGAGFTGTSWTVAKWNSNFDAMAEMLLLSTDVSSRIPFSGHSIQVSSTESVRRISRFSGRLASARLLDTIEFFVSGANLDSLRVWIEGHAA